MLFEEMEAGFADLTTIEQKKQRYANSPDAKTAKALATFHYTNSQSKEALSYYKDAVRYDKENDYTYEQFDVISSGMRRKHFTLDEMKSAADNALASNSVEAGLKARIYLIMSNYAGENKDDEKILSYIKDGYNFALAKKDEINKAYLDRLAIANAFFIEKDSKKAVDLKKKSMKPGWMDNANDLNGFSWWCFENKVNLEEAGQLAKRGAKLAEPGANKAMILDTAAEIVYALGSTDEAITLMEQAMKEDPKNEYWKKQLDKFKRVKD